MEDAADLLWVVNRERQRETQPERLSASLGRVNKRGSELFRYPVPVPYFLQDSKTNDRFLLVLFTLNRCTFTKLPRLS